MEMVATVEQLRSANLNLIKWSQLAQILRQPSLNVMSFNGTNLLAHKFSCGY